MTSVHSPPSVLTSFTSVMIVRGPRLVGPRRLLDPRCYPDPDEQTRRWDCYQDRYEPYGGETQHTDTTAPRLDVEDDEHARAASSTSGPFARPMFPRCGAVEPIRTGPAAVYKLADGCTPGSRRAAGGGCGGASPSAVVRCLGCTAGCTREPTVLHQMGPAAIWLRAMTWAIPRS